MSAGSDIAKSLYCSGLLEEKVAEAYKHIAQLVDDKTVKCLLIYIANDSLKHAECFKMAAGLLSQSAEACPEDCVKAWGEIWLEIVRDSERICGKTGISSAELKSIIDGLERIESFAAEEYLTILHTKLIDLMASEKGLDLGSIKTILNWIIEDEDKHKQILEIIKGMIIR